MTTSTLTETDSTDSTTNIVNDGAAAGTENDSHSGEDATETPKPWDRQLDSLPQDVADYIRELRNENKGKRTEATEAATKLTSVLDALGLGEKQNDDPKVLAEQAATERDTALSQARAAVVELAIYRSAVTEGANPEALTDSRTFMQSVADLDPSDDEFSTKVTNAIKAAVSKNSALRSTPPTQGSGSADFTGGNSGTDVTAEKFAVMTSDQKLQLFQSNPTLYRQLAG